MGMKVFIKQSTGHYQFITTMYCRTIAKKIAIAKKPIYRLFPTIIKEKKRSHSDRMIF